LKVLFGRRALQELREIFDHIAAQDLVTAQAVEDEIFQQCDRIGLFPRASPAIRTPGVRRCPMSKYPFTIFYRLNEQREAVTIIAIVRSTRLRNLERVPR
jgi:plasmid stabilization system protein ParE